MNSAVLGRWMGVETYCSVGPGAVKPEQIQRFIRESIATAHTLELRARDRKAFQEATSARAKTRQSQWAGSSEGWGHQGQWVSSDFLKRKEKEEEQARKRKERGEEGWETAKLSAGSN